MTGVTDRRKAKRFSLSIDVKFLLRGDAEGVGRLLDISEGGLALFADTNAEEGDDIVLYPEGIGRLTGKVVRVFERGLGITFTLSKSQRETIRERILAAMNGEPYLRLSESRSHIRIRYNIETTAFVEGEEKPITCTIVDMSRSGCLLQGDRIPPLGSNVTVGALYGRVVRYSDEGFAVQFRRPGALSQQAGCKEQSAA